jgi:hypothetical protein
MDNFDSFHSLKGHCGWSEVIVILVEISILWLLALLAVLLVALFILLGRDLSKSNSDWRWLISDEVLEGTSGHVVVEESAEVVSISSLGKSNSDWGWLVSDEILQSSSGDIVIEKG